MSTAHDSNDHTTTLRRWSPAARIIAVVAATTMLVGAVLTNADAQPRGFVETTHTEALFYGDFDLELPEGDLGPGIALFAGGTAEDFCPADHDDNPETPPITNEPDHDARIFERNDGTFELMVDSSRQPIFLYATPLGGPQLVAAVCDALAEGSEPLQPFAEGEGLVRMRMEIAPDGTVDIVNSALGSATSTDGTTWQVRGWADLTIVDGAPVGSPTEFQGIRVTRTGR